MTKFFVCNGPSRVEQCGGDDVTVGRKPDAGLKPVCQEAVMKWIAAIVGAIVGYQVGFYVVATGAHGDSAWPTLLFSGPVWMFAAAFGDDMGYVRAMMFGTSVLYAIYGWCLACFRSWRTVLTIVMMHLPFALLSLVF